MSAAQILIDLNKIGNPYAGLGQVSLGFYKALSSIWQENPIPNTTLILMANDWQHFKPQKNIQFVKPPLIGRWFSFLNSGYNIWHSLHQDSDWQPAAGKTKQILNIHDLNFLYEKSAIKAHRKLAEVQKKVNRADVITAISNYTKTEVEKHITLNGKSITTLYNGVDTLEFSSAQSPLSGNFKSPFYLTLAHLSAKKNIAPLLHLMALLPDQNLVIAGNDETLYATQLKELAQTLKLNNIYFTGKISAPEKAWLYQHCEAFFFPSLLEGFGLPVIEAMQAGKPIYISNQTSLPEIANGHACIWQNFDAHDMKQSLIEYMSQETEQHIQDRKNYAATFSWEHYVMECINIYKQLL
jgi:glycosyltransferase involved in cell wall biosynthesis